MGQKRTRVTIDYAENDDDYEGDEERKRKWGKLPGEKDPVFNFARKKESPQKDPSGKSDGDSEDLFKEPGLDGDFAANGEQETHRTLQGTEISNAGGENWEHIFSLKKGDPLAAYIYKAKGVLLHDPKWILASLDR